MIIMNLPRTVRFVFTYNPAAWNLRVKDEVFSLFMFMYNVSLLNHNVWCVLQKRLAKEARFQETQAKNASLGKKVKEAQAGKAYKSREASYYRVSCKV